MKIYNIIDKNNLRYVGKTSQSLKIRMTNHKSDKKTRPNNCSSSKLDLDNCVILLIEECSQEKVKERELFWINRLNCVNHNNGSFNKKEYIKEWKKNNRERVNERQRITHHARKLKQ